MSNLITARETVTTYADGKGRWYARVDFAPGYTPDQIGRHIDRIRAKARRYIRAELTARQGAPLGPVRVEVTEDHWRHGQSPDHMNVWWSITYRERD